MTQQEPICPVCRHPDVTPLWATTSADAAQHFILREADPERYARLAACIARLWQGDTCQVMECTSCGFGFAWPYVAGDAEFYELAYPRAAYPNHRPEYDLTLAALRGLPAGRRALEIGAGTGVFLGMVPRWLVPAETAVTIEYSPGGRESLARAGYRVSGEDVRSDAFLSHAGRFDLVFMFQVLEHLGELDALLDRLSLITAPDASIFISVPNSARILWHEQHGGLMDMPPNHIGRWNAGALAALCRRFGFAVIEAEAVPFEGLAAFARDDAISVFQRRAQQRGSLANRTKRLGRGKVRRLVELAVLALYALRRVSHWRAGLAPIDFGATLWVHLKKA